MMATYRNERRIALLYDSSKNLIIQMSISNLPATTLKSNTYKEGFFCNLECLKIQYISVLLVKTRPSYSLQVHDIKVHKTYITLILPNIHINFSLAYIFKQCNIKHKTSTHKM